MIPPKIKPYFNVISQSVTHENSYIEGELSCCQTFSFELKTNGEVKNNLFFGWRLVSQEEMTINAICKRCGKVISVFDSGCDGYARLEHKKSALGSTNTIRCKKCKNDAFSLLLKYEYPSDEELETLGLNDPEAAFTWIWGTIKCDKCGSTFKNIINFATD